MGVKASIKINYLLEGSRVIASPGILLFICNIYTLSRKEGTHH